VKKFFFNMFIILLFLISLNLISAEYWDNVNTSVGIYSGYNTNEFGATGSLEIGYSDVGIEFGGNYIHNNLIYMKTGVNYYPTENIVVGGSYSYYPGNADVRNSNYKNGYESYNGNINCDFGLVDTGIQYKKDNDGHWYGANVEYNVNDNWGVYGDYQYSPNLENKISTGLKYTWDSTYKRK
jgi:lipopolysaccharide assembly outer membrane protein LptD (OstA)